MASRAGAAVLCLGLEGATDLWSTRVTAGEERDGAAEMGVKLQVHLRTMHGCVAVHGLLLQRLETSGL